MKFLNKYNRFIYINIILFFFILLSDNVTNMEEIYIAIALFLFLYNGYNLSYKFIKKWYNMSFNEIYKNLVITKIELYKHNIILYKYYTIEMYKWDLLSYEFKNLITSFIERNKSIIKNFQQMNFFFIFYMKKQMMNFFINYLKVFNLIGFKFIYNQLIYFLLENIQKLEINNEENFNLNYTFFKTICNKYKGN